MSFPTPPKPIQPTTTEELDKAINRLVGGKDAWAALKPDKREVLLNECLTDLEAVAEEWIRTSIRAKGFEPNTPGEGEEWIGAFSPIVRNIRLLAHAMKHGGKPPLPSVSTNAQGQKVVQVFPLDIKEKLMFAGFSAEVWLEKGKEASQGEIYRNPTPPKVALVLGAGNQGSIGPMDCLYKLFVENQVCILKMNPVNAHLGPYIARAFRSLIEGNFITVVYGGAEEGAYMCRHELIDTIHITGSHHTHNAIVWGEKRGEEPVLNKPITSELGCVDPIIVVPGSWNDKQLNYHAKQVVSMVTHNAGFNCNAGNVLVVAKGWAQKDQFTKKVEQLFRSVPPRKAYYPGAAERHKGFCDQYGDAIFCSETKEGTLPWTILPNVPAQEGEYAHQNEPFCGILSITEIDAQTAPDFLEKAIPFCNEHIWGTLSCTVIIDPKTENDNKQRFEQAIADLRYGTIAINAWNGVGYSLSTTTWGAYPGHTLSDVCSGIGIMHNTLLLDHPQKSVIRAPFLISPTPAWFYSNRNLVGLGKKLTAFEFKPSWLRFLGVISKAIRG
jgi:acyl-CoA reductase-like NAD-dependent aldehyde dehydrogenase